MDWYFEKVQSVDFGIWLKQPLVRAKDSLFQYTDVFV